MSRALIDLPYDWDEIVQNLVTEDDESADNMYSAKEQRLLVEPLYSSWTPPPVSKEASAEGRKFLADANVGVFQSPFLPPLVPDMFLSLDVQPHEDWHAKEHRSYFIWEFEKAPEVVVEIVSNRKGGEMGEKLRRYAKMDVTYYVVYDRFKVLGDVLLRVYERGFGRRYRQRKDFQLPEVGLSLTLWQGVYETLSETWLRWCDLGGNIIPTGAERAAKAENLAAQTKDQLTKAEAENAALREELERLKKQVKAKKRK